MKGRDIKCITVPSFKGLAVEDIFMFAEPIYRLSSYLPDTKGRVKFVNRSWMCNVVNKLWENEFKKFILKSYNNRETYIIQKKNLKVQAKPEFINLFRKSESVSRKLVLLMNINMSTISEDPTTCSENQTKEDWLS